ncbi:Oxygen regulatory protein NreC [Kordia antarctica]|uniref:Oxygen regulatory protein NreC n=1 Tax=Kordia antarctica TaxID=1218801 RepID=A0A7L4ZHK6_9FLAO|nr:response regulator transcription factor [Kordia antarctica]QHI35957.1 Oxygen regulatory protein NreC [Kordia antarctica]
MIHVLIADDHDVVIEGLKSVIQTRDDIIIVGEATNGKDVIPLLHQEIDVAILDISMPEMDGIELAKHIQKNFPKIKVLIVSMHDNAKFIRESLLSGAKGYILKDKVKQDLLPAIFALADGNDYYAENVKNTIMHSQKSPNMYGELKLTQRELEVLKLIAFGYSSKEIAEMLSRSVATINTHRKNLIGKTGVKNSKELIKFAIKKGYD